MQEKMPVVDMLERWAGKSRHRLHMPGHKGGRGLDNAPGFDALRFDATELADTDDLFAPAGALKEAMELAAAGFSAVWTRFLTAGATAGVLAMLLSLEPGSNVVVGRDCHRSVAAGVELAGLRPVFVYPEAPEDGLPGCVCPDRVEDALKKRRAGAVVVTYPNYYGLCPDLGAIRAAADRHGALLLVDGAHGTHFASGASALPPYAGRFADVWVDGAHKTIGAMGQGAFLHMGARAREKEKGMARETLERALALVHTSSPSYPVLASLDASRQRLFTKGAEWQDFALSCQEALRSIDALPGLACPGLSATGRAGVAAYDPTRLVVDVRGRGLTGYAAAPILKSAGIEVEMCDGARVVGIAAPWDPAALTALRGALAALKGAGRGECPHEPALPPFRAQAMRPASRRVELVEVAVAKGRVAAAAVGAYPPGIPALWPGEAVNADAVRYLMGVLNSGGRLFGLQDGRLPVFGIQAQERGGGGETQKKGRLNVKGER